MSSSNSLQDILLNHTSDSVVADAETTTFHHVPVLLTEVMTGLAVQSGELYLDCTVGGGGHTGAILAVPDTQVVAIDQDDMALAAAANHLASFAERITFWRGNFSEYAQQQPNLNVAAKFDGILADLGVSSAQLDLAERGFSFREAGALDMRMDRRQEITAADLVNTASEKDLADWFFHYGEERYARKIARGLVQKRPFYNTTDLAYAVGGCVPPSYRHGRIHPATRVFQALRIVVNGELEHLKSWLGAVPDLLKPGGRLAVISFHSLEDRLVKTAFREDPRLQVVTKKPIIASEAETVSNPRSRSAKLRVAIRQE
ncbi:MAG: 16S rRNA (cytosine(1402)-N(4))-methyltransferase RsmH [Pseudanabaena sp. ELA607]